LPSNAGPVFLEAHEIYGELDHVNVDAMIDPSASSMGGQDMFGRRLQFLAPSCEEPELHSCSSGPSSFFLADLKADACGGTLPDRSFSI
jgi:hypothetical protein